MTTARDIDMKEVRTVCDRAIVDYAANLAIADEGTTRQLFARIGRLLAAAAATDYLQSPGDDLSDQRNVAGFHSKPDDQWERIEILDEWRVSCADREADGDRSRREYWRVEREAAERVRAFVVEL